MFSFRNAAEPKAEDTSPATSGVIGRLGRALRRSRGALVDGITALMGRKAQIDDVLIEEIEALLLSSDVGVGATQRIIEGLQKRVAGRAEGSADVVVESLRADMLDILRPVSRALQIPQRAKAPFVILMVGVNGTGKTTTIGKLAYRLRENGKSVMLAAGDTFRAAAIEQLQSWGARENVPVIAQHPGADSASVIFDACEAAAARHVDVLIADTAGRLHTQTGLMDELKKIRRVVSRLDPQAPHEVMLVLDAGTGQNALAQAEQFGNAVGVTGLTLTKLDGTAKGGIVFAIAEKLGLPVRYVGLGENEEDLREFDADEFVDALLKR